jgi:hypothetical protein
MNQTQIQDLATLLVGFIAEAQATRDSRAEVEGVIALRDTFAMCALIGLRASGDRRDHEIVARFCYDEAYEMLLMRTCLLQKAATLAEASEQSETRDTEPPPT